MALSDDLQALNQPPPSRPCSIARILSEVDADTGDVLRASLANKDVTPTRLTQVLRDNGHSLSDGVVAKHRAGTCRCSEAGP